MSIPVAKDEEKFSIDQKPRIRINDVLTCKRAAIDGTGFAVIPRRIAEQDVKNRRLVPLLTDYNFPTVTICAMYASRQWMPTKLKAFLEYLEEWK